MPLLEYLHIHARVYIYIYILKKTFFNLSVRISNIKLEFILIPKLI
jgi:hypothetical protein